LENHPLKVEPFFALMSVPASSSRSMCRIRTSKSHRDNVEVDDVCSLQRRILRIKDNPLKLAS
jgi:hypothetical protein